MTGLEVVVKVVKVTGLVVVVNVVKVTGLVVVVKEERKGEIHLSYRIFHFRSLVVAIY